MLVTKKKYNKLRDEYQHLYVRIDLLNNLLEQKKTAIAEANKRHEEFKNSYRTLHRIITQFRANPNRVTISPQDIFDIDQTESITGQSKKEWL